ncbi:class I SAM-dependent methyltransferase [Plantactinospora sp. WMMC1484]|uniref:class I SAM-dependent methyltransferase n=1 Tax=Plantactinospora sp. WMMC1484 TaxID=3404122 RepID=UPI003BF57C8B
MTVPAVPADEVDARALAGRLFEASLACAELMTCYLGLELGLYAELAESPATSVEAAERAGAHERYVREWLEQQASAGVLAVDDVRRPPQIRRYALPPGHGRALLDAADPHYVASMALTPVGTLAGMLPKLVAAFRIGGGIGGEDFAGFHGAGLNTALYRRKLPRWIAEHLPDVEARLGAGAAIADIACGAGHSTVALARAYPHATVTGFDIDATALRAARGQLPPDASGRVSYVEADAAALEGEPAALVCVLDSLHDMARPIEVLRAARRLVADGGCVLLLEPRADERFAAPADPVERFVYACSVLHCLPVAMSDPGAQPTGAVLRPPTLRALAARAGFSAMHVLPAGSRFHRLYRLNP